MTASIFLLGAARTGSTALADMMADSFDLELARDKETHFLASRALLGPSGGPDGPRFDRLRDTTLRQFRARFSSSPSVGILDASASSLFYASSTRAVLDEYFPDSYLVAVLRNPADRALSAYRYMKARGLENLNWSDALAAEPARHEAGWPHIWQYAAGGGYAAQIGQLGRWADRTLFLLYEADLQNPVDLAYRVSEHTGLAMVREPQLGRKNESLEFSRRSIGKRAEWLRSLPVVQHAPSPLRRLGRVAVDALRSESGDGAGSYDLSSLASLVAAEGRAVEALTGLPAVEAWS